MQGRTKRNRTILKRTVKSNEISLEKDDQVKERQLQKKNDNPALKMNEMLKNMQRLLKIGSNENQSLYLKRRLYNSTC